MAPPSKAPVPPRNAVKKRAAQQHAQSLESQGVVPALKARVVSNVVEATPTPDPRAIVPPLPPTGQEQLYNFYLPSLESGEHTITVTQTIKRSDGQDETLIPEATQDFEVVGPRFSLPDGEVHSTYPPQGHGDHLNILPHVVLEDPHLPWERPSSAKYDSTNTRHQIPWLALLVFDQSELQLNQAQLQGDQKIFPSDSKQSPTWSVNMSINDLWTMQTNQAISTPVANTKGDPIDKTTAAQSYDFIFLQSQSFQAYFQGYSDTGQPLASQPNADVSRYEFLSHVRNINTAGMPDDATGGNDQGLFSVVVAHRTGPWTITQPTPVVVHLVSIEGIEVMPFQPTASYVALCSLYSWTYQALPPDNFNCFDAMNHLGSTVDVLRGPGADRQSGSVEHNVYKRIQDGFTLGQWRVSSGEQTFAMWRGPFTPANVPHTLLHQSTFSTDLELMDPQLGIMDISYSLAWQLGKTMAVADQAFTAAFSRIRSTIHSQAYQSIKDSILGSDQISVPNLVANLKSNAKVLGSSATTSPQFNGDSKWQNSITSATTGTGFFSPDVRVKFLEAATKVAKWMASSTDSTDPRTAKDDTGYRFYNEHNKPTSTDWALMMEWLLNRMFLYGVPAHYLITDPSILPKESLRFFVIDPNWIDAFVDGALSICNHIEGDDDQIRTSIKVVWNDYLQTQDPDIKYAPQIPHSGFLLRSALIKQFPDLKVEAAWDNNQGQHPILRQENIAEDVLLVLFDRTPGDGLLKQIVFTQPPHQQCFAAADDVGPNPTDATQTIFEVGYKQLYTTTTGQATGTERREEIFKQTWSEFGTNSASSYDWTKHQLVAGATPVNYTVFDFFTRCLIFPSYALAQRDILGAHMQGKYTDTEANSAAVAIQLNEPMYRFVIDIPTRPQVNMLAMSQTAPKPGAVKTMARLDRLGPHASQGVAKPIQPTVQPLSAATTAASGRITSPGALPDRPLPRSTAGKKAIRPAPSRPVTGSSPTTTVAQANETGARPVARSASVAKPAKITSPNSSTTPAAETASPSPGPASAHSKKSTSATSSKTKSINKTISAASSSSNPSLVRQMMTAAATVSPNPSTHLISNPMYSLSCYPAGYSKGSAIPANAGFAVDLVFGISFVGSAQDLASGCRLSQLEIDLNLGDNTHTNCLTSYYNGDKATMLSNLRWNCLLVPFNVNTTTNLPTQIRITLIPRSSTSPPALSRSQELGFILTEVDVNAYAINQTWNLTAWETYLDPQGNPMQAIMNSSCAISIQPHMPPPQL